MPPSQLKQLKASIRDRRESGGKKTQLKDSSKNRNGADLKAQKKKPKSEGEEKRRASLLPELQRRNKVGGIIDRRIGENDPTMTPEDRALQRYARQRKKRDSTFNLEEDGTPDELTHMGRSIFSGIDANAVDDFVEGDLGVDGESDDEFIHPARKRLRLSDSNIETEDNEGDIENQQERKKSKQEVMQEVMAKSKLYKYERQKARDEDEDLRETLNADLPDLLAILRQRSVQQPPPAARGSALSELQGTNIHNSGNDSNKQQSAEKEYDQRLRLMAQEKRAQPTERTKTAEEKAEAEAKRLQELENERMRRMKGEETEEESDEEAEDDEAEDDETADYQVESDEAENLLGASLPSIDEVDIGRDLKSEPLGVEDEDDFVIDKDLVASGSEIDTDISEESLVTGDEDSDDDATFLKDVLPEVNGNSGHTVSSEPRSSELPFTYPCPQNHTELLEVVENIPTTDLLLVIQRIRALYHPQLDQKNTERLSNFAAALVDHLPHLASQKAPLEAVESVIRHIHSMSRKLSEATAKAFRTHLQKMQSRQSITPGDLYILTAIGSIYPTSDHFHQVVTPAITLIARWLGTQCPPRTDQDSRTGAYLVALALKYQALSKRYIPEAIRFTELALKANPRGAQSKSHVTNIESMMNLWSSKAAFIEAFSPGAVDAVELSGDMNTLKKLRILLSQSQLRRRPLELHHHRPLPIRSAIPKFEENFNPDRHYDPDRERAEANKLRKEYRREKKGAIRELRKDANFIAREKLRAKKEADKAYEAKQRRLIAEIQGEEGKEKNAYEREKRKRQSMKRR